jgi:molybdopterin-binding protein
VLGRDGGGERVLGERVGRQPAGQVGEVRSGRCAGEGQVPGVGEDQGGVRGAALGAGLAEHFGCQVDGDHGAGRADGLAQGPQGPAGAAADVDDHTAWADAGLGDGGGVGGQVVAELGVPDASRQAAGPGWVSVGAARLPITWGVPVMKLSARNQIPARVTGINTGEAIANVELDAGGVRLVASITVEAVEKLGLAEGSQVTAVVKASDVILATGA